MARNHDVSVSVTACVPHGGRVVGAHPELVDEGDVLLNDEPNEYHHIKLYTNLDIYMNAAVDRS